MAVLQHTWGNFPDNLRGLALPAIERGRMKASSRNDLQNCIVQQFRQQFSTTVLENVPISEFGIPGSKAEVDW